MASPDCSQNTDSLKLVREGTSQDGRLLAAQSPGYAPPDQHEPAHGIVFAQDFAALLKYYNAENLESGDWLPFFNRDVSAQLALLATEDIDAYKVMQKGWFDFINNRDNNLQPAKLKERLAFLYASLGTLAKQLDVVQLSLPGDMALKDRLQNQIRHRLAPAFKNLIAYYRGGLNLHLISDTPPVLTVTVLRAPVAGFNDVLDVNDFLSGLWSNGQPWHSYATGITGDESVYGSETEPFEKINHCASHALFTAIFEDFLQVFARVIIDAGKELQQTLTKLDTHEPHYALYLAFLRLFENARSTGNTLTKKHLDFYYRRILQLKEKAAKPGQVHLLVELAKQTGSHNFKAGQLFKAGKDSQGQDAFFANDRDFVANQARLAGQKTLYRYTAEEATALLNAGNNVGRLYASPVANSDDGQGAKLTNADLSWHPFYNKFYTNGLLSEIRMPEAEIGFAVASHYLLLREGARTITVVFTLTADLGQDLDAVSDITCMLTAEKDWFTVDVGMIEKFGEDQGNSSVQLTLTLSGGDPAVVPYRSDVHGYNFGTDLPVLLVKLLHRNGEEFVYPELQNLCITAISLSVKVDKLRTLALSNDFGPIDASKPFQPFGPMPAAGSGLIIGSKEVFQKNIVELTVHIVWQPKATAYTRSKAFKAKRPTGPTTKPSVVSANPTITAQRLVEGEWIKGTSSNNYDALEFNVIESIDDTVVDSPDFTSDESYTTNKRYGYVKLTLSSDLGQAAYQEDLVTYLAGKGAEPSTAPVAPAIGKLYVNYKASTTLPLDTSDAQAYENRPGRFFHLTPFGSAERHPHLTGSGEVTLLPQFSISTDGEAATSEAEFYIGISGLIPPQNLSLLFQVVAGSANPLVVKPPGHIHWSFLSGNNWIDFKENEIEDATAGLIESGIVTFSVPRQATNDNTLLPAGMHWLRAAVLDKSDAVCRLQLVAAQALKATFVDRNNAQDFSAVPLAAGKISKLEPPDAAVKSVSQPFASFGGRGAEQSPDFYARVAERLRHKDRAIGLWDFEHLILEAFPQIYKVKCLNHTQYEPTEDRQGVYRELAPGHVTIVAIPRLSAQSQRDPLKPYTSLGLLNEIADFLNKRTSCFAQLHVRNPEFEEVWVRFNLRLRAGYDVTYYKNQLQQAIVRFLSPWAFSESGSPSFGGKIYKSVLIDFIETQPYVDYITDFKLFRGLASITDVEEVQGSTAVSILVSAPAEQHEIYPIISAPESGAGETCSCES